MRIAPRLLCGLLVLSACLLWGTTAHSTNAEECGPRPAGISRIGKEFIRQLEGFRTTAYYDVNGYAIGYGMHMWQGEPVTRHYPGAVTFDEVEEEFDSQLSWYGSIVSETVCAPLSQPAFDGLTSLVWNLGRVNTSILTKVERRLPIRASDFLTTAHVGKKRPKILVQRRLREYLMFAGDYQRALAEQNVSQLYRHTRLLKVHLHD